MAAGAATAATAVADADDVDAAAAAADLIINQDVRVLVHDIEQVRLEERMMTTDDRQILLTCASESAWMCILTFTIYIVRLTSTTYYVVGAEVGAVVR